MALLEVTDLKTSFATVDGPVGAVDGISFTVEPGRVLGIVGESGCGKSVTSLSIMGLLPKKTATTTGSIVFDGRDLITVSSDEMRQIRGDEMAMIFQDPMTSLNPVYTIGWQLEEAVMLHRDVSRGVAHERSRAMLEAVGIPSPGERLKSYPHELSGGMRQRVMIAMALINDPKLLIADEPTTALDVTTQAQIIDLIRSLNAEFESAVIMITHDLGVVAELCDEVIVMYAGKVVEQGTVFEIFEKPQHPYTWGLLGSLPGRNVHSDRLYSIPGTPPSLLNPPAGCRFAPRCAFHHDACDVPPGPPLVPVMDSTQEVRCVLDQETRTRHAKELGVMPGEPATNASSTSVSGTNASGTNVSGTGGVAR
jgi:oligopeptide/dipeptide ABC transporter ATP-binding protein